jgi:ankyrin repeat protein
MTLAVLNGSYNCVRELEAIGANCLEKDAYGHTYLHIAAISGHVNIFLFFLSKQVNIHAKARGKTALELAEKYDHVHLINYIRQKFLANTILSQQP